MELVSPIHGKINYSEDEVIKFVKPIPGFDYIHNYILKDIEDSEFKLLQAIEDVNIGFVVISPFTVENDYEIKLSEEVITDLKIENPNDVLLLSLVTLHSKTENITANLRAPIIININNKNGEQYISEKEKYKIKHPIMKG